MMLGSRGSSTIEHPTQQLPSPPPRRSDGEITNGREPTGLTDAHSPRRPASRALLDPIDASSSLWGEGRRERIAELEVALRLRQSGNGREARASPQCGRRPTTDQQSPRKSSGSNRRRSRPEGSFRGGGEGGGNDGPTVPGGGNTQGADKVATTNNSNDNDDNGVDDNDDNDTVCDRRVREGRSRPSVAGGSLTERLEAWNSEGWRPPPLRDLPRGGEGFFSGCTHIGAPDRFELVKSANRSVGCHGEELTDEELEWAVLCLEEAEARMTTMEFSVAAGILERVVERCPGFTLAYYRLALCLLAARGKHASDQARLLLECAVHLEGAENPHVRNAVDLVHRMLRNDDIPEDYWSEDYPKSLGDLRALETAIDNL